MLTLYTVGTIKDVAGMRRYVAVDGGMSDNIRPALYQARYTFLTALRPDAPHDREVTIAGKLCETGDILARVRPLTVTVAVPLAAAYASRDVVLPVAGRATGADGRLFLTALWVTNPSERDSVDATLTFSPAEEKLLPHGSALHLNPGETRVVDPIDEKILGVPAALGSLRIEATHDVLATARVYSRGLTTSFNALPVQFAIGNNESATLQGVAPADGPGTCSTSVTASCRRPTPAR